MATLQEERLRAASPSIDRNPAASAHYEALLGCLDGLGFDARRPKVIGFVSSLAGAGVSTIASNLAIEVARGGFEKVLLIDANLQRPRLHDVFGAPPEPGLVQAMACDPPVEECVRRSDFEMLNLLTAGTNGRAGASGLRAREFTAVLHEIRSDYDLVVVDLPPATDLSFSFTVAGILDGVVLVVEAERDPIEKLQRVKRKFVQANAKLLGVVLNKCRRCS